MKQMILNLMPILFLALITLAVYYVSRRLSWAFGVNSKLFTLIASGVVIFFMTTLVVIMRTNLTSGISHIVNNISSIGLGALAILIFTLLAVDLLHLAVKLSPRIFGFSVVGVTLLVTIFSIWNAINTKVYHQDIQLTNLQTPIKIAQLTDIHIGHFWGKETVKKLIKKVERENVDLIVITGDMFDGRVRLKPDVLEPFKRVNVPVFFVEGNHDGYSGAADIKKMLRDNNIIVLDNKIVNVNGLQIVGLDYLMPDSESVNTFHAPIGKLTMKDVLPTLGIDKERASVLLHHNPVGVNYASDNGINLYLAGHTHAGQMFPATLIAKMMFEFNKGLYKYNDTTQVYVSQGTGTFGPPMRLGTRSEITILSLIPTKSF